MKIDPEPVLGYREIMAKTQVELNKKKYSLTYTYQIETESSYVKLVDSAKRNNIPYDIKVK
jgi:hypothetical protein